MQRTSKRIHQLINLRISAACSSEIPQTYSTLLSYTVLNLYSIEQTHPVESSEFLFQLYLLCFVSTEWNKTTEGQKLIQGAGGRYCFMLILTSKVGPYNSEFKADFRVAQVMHIPQRQ